MQGDGLCPKYDRGQDIPPKCHMSQNIIWLQSAYKAFIGPPGNQLISYYIIYPFMHKHYGCGGWA